MRSQLIFPLLLIKVVMSGNLRLLEFHEGALSLNHLDLPETSITLTIFPFGSDELYETVSVVADVLPHA